MALELKDGNITGSSGVAKAGLTLGIIGTALGAYALNRRGIGLCGNNYGMPENVNINANLGL